MRYCTLLQKSAQIQKSNNKSAHEFDLHSDPLRSNIVKLIEMSHGSIWVIFIIRLSITQIWNNMINMRGERRHVIGKNIKAMKLDVSRSEFVMKRVQANVRSM